MQKQSRETLMDNSQVVITEYQTLSGSLRGYYPHNDHIDTKVRALIKEGWQPYGSPFFLQPPSLNGVECFQVMVKYGKLQRES